MFPEGPEDSQEGVAGFGGIPQLRVGTGQRGSARKGDLMAGFASSRLLPAFYRQWANLGLFL